MAQMLLLIAQTSIKPSVGIRSFEGQDSEVEMYSLVLVSSGLIEQEVGGCVIR